MPEIKKITGSQESIIQLDLDDEEEEISPHQRRRYSVSPMPQMQRSSESQTSGRSTPETPLDDLPQIPPVGIILIHKPCGEPCSTSEDKKVIEENFSRYATYPIVRGKCLVTNKCTCDLDSAPPPQNIHQTLDFPKSKKHSKRPTIIKSDCDQNDSNSEINSSDAKN